MALLHRLVGACHLTFMQQGTCGIRLVSAFLRRTGLGRFVASFLGSRRALAQLEQALLDYGASQRIHLASRMTPKPITVCEDETFDPQVGLVSIEPASDFLLLEVSSQGCDATSWTSQLTGALEGLPVEVVSVTGDEANGPLAHARDGLGAHQRPNLFTPSTTWARRPAFPSARSPVKPKPTSTEHASRPSGGSSGATPRPRRPPGCRSSSGRWWPGWKPLNNAGSQFARRSEDGGRLPSLRPLQRSPL